jgi:endoglucanase
LITIAAFPQTVEDFLVKPISFCFAAAFLLQASFSPAADAPFSPANPPGMTPLTNRQSPAYRAAKLFQRGVNLGDYLEAGKYAVKIDADEFARMKAEGFDHVRIPTGWHRYAGPAPDFKLSPEIFAKADFAITNALNNHLAVIINIHHFNELDRNPTNAMDEFIAIWRQVAEHYRDFPNTLAFELDNEPHDAATTAVMNDIYPKVIFAIRETNPARTLFVEPGNWGGIQELKNLVLPPDDNLIVSVHCYDPFLFTHQGTSWAGPDVKVTGFKFPGPPEKPLVPDPSLKVAPHVLEQIKKYNTLPTTKNPISPLAFKGKLAYARAWSDHYGRPVHVGEFGCYVKIDPESRARFYKAFRQALDEQKLGWAIWDWSANFRYWDKKNNQPMPGMRDALFGK